MDEKSLEQRLVRLLAFPLVQKLVDSLVQSLLVQKLLGMELVENWLVRLLALHLDLRMVH